VRCGAAIHWFGRQDYKLPDRRLRYLRFASWHAFIDRALYLPKEWTDDPDRLGSHIRACDTGFATKPKLATAMIARAIAAAVPFKWVAADTVYGVGDIEQQLRQAGKGYVLGVSRAHVFDPGQARSVSGTRRGHRLDAAVVRLETLSAGDGTKGPRLHDWCYLELADLDAGQFNSANDGLWTRAPADPSSYRR